MVTMTDSFIIKRQPYRIMSALRNAEVPSHHYYILSSDEAHMSFESAQLLSGVHLRLKNLLFRPCCCGSPDRSGGIERLYFLIF